MSPLLLFEYVVAVGLGVVVVIAAALVILGMLGVFDE